MAETYVCVGCKPWNEAHFREIESSAGFGDWHYIGEKSQLTLPQLKELNPRYVFFLHWSWIVPEEIFTAFECVVFHMTDVPYGRGGSPLQNLIARGHRETKLSALRMEKGLDTGPVYRKRALSLEGSSAEEIFVRAGRMSCEMALEIASQEPEPLPQTGEVTEFKRRRPEDGQLPESGSLDQVHDLIRMLDADGYPPAFIKHGDLQLEFKRSTRYHDRVVAEVTIRKSEESR